MVAAFGMPFCGATLNAIPLHVVAVCAGITGFVFNVTVKVNGAPAQVPAAPDTGVTVYTTV
jgi:hypothetical protein